MQVFITQFSNDAAQSDETKRAIRSQAMRDFRRRQKEERQAGMSAYLTHNRPTLSVPRVCPDLNLELTCHSSTEECARWSPGFILSSSET